MLALCLHTTYYAQSYAGILAPCLGMRGPYSWYYSSWLRYCLCVSANTRGFSLSNYSSANLTRQFTSLPSYQANVKQKCVLNISKTYVDMCHSSTFLTVSKMSKEDHSVLAVSYSSMSIFMPHQEVTGNFTGTKACFSFSFLLFVLVHTFSPQLHIFYLLPHTTMYLCSVPPPVSLSEVQMGPG